MLKIKSMMSLLICVALLTSVVACGKGNTSSEDTANSKIGGSNKISSTIKIPEELVGTTVKYATWIDEYEVESGPVITDFINKTGIQIELVNIPQGNYAQKLSAMIAAGTAPDIFRETNEWPHLLPLAQSIENSGIKVSDPLWDQSTVKFGTVGGKPYLVNTVGSIWSERNMVFYNKDIFSDNGLTTPEEYMKANNWTWETFRKCMKDVKDCGIQYGGYIDTDSFVNSVGASMVRYENGVFSNGTSDPKLQEAVVFVNKAIKDGIASINVYASDFSNGKCGLFVSGTYGCKASGYFSGMDADKIGYAMMPKYNKDQKDYTYSSFPLAWGILKGAENPVGAGHFLTYFLDSENYKKAGSYDTAFKSEEAKKFFEKTTSVGFTNGAGYVDVTNGSAKLISTNGKYYLRDMVFGKDPLQVATYLKSAGNKVDEIVGAANKTVQETIEKNK